ncbi:glycosyltransferase family 2 protein [Conexibacter sp. DBS9H8]|uniref:glycosyltransferase family 2 protein n=1 Tax=Conexibacter sp. DBS9H8 TaxID=2937801 RepID=UPI002010B840|nr:glycosyltransferase family 2 protein [Conexibacter sp. DBS9H8]
MQVTVAVVSWNTRELLRDCLDSLAPDAAAGVAEVWVHDNASTDGSAELVAADYPWVRLIAAPDNVGFGAAVNAVATRTRRRGRPEWLAAANADTALTPGALRALIDAGRHDPRAGALAPRLLLPDGSTQHSIHPFPGVWAALAFNAGLTTLSPRLADRLTLDGHWDPSRSRRVDWAHGAFVLFRRSAFDAVGGFDPHQFLYAEDIDLAWRLAQTGAYTRYVPAALVRHRHGAAIAQLYGADRDLQAQRSAYAWLLRRRGSAAMRSTALLNAIGAGVRATSATLRGRSHPPTGGLAAWQLRRQTRMHLEGLLSPRARLEAHR